MTLHNINLLKGVLILLVITGHVIQGNITENISRYMIYSFHMPVFIGISGFLFNTEKVSKLSFIGLLKKYTTRLIIPWFIAILAYSVLAKIRKIDNLGDFLTVAVNGILNPFYHLWYVAGFMSWITLTWVLMKVKFKLNSIMILAFAISFVFLQALHLTLDNSTISSLVRYTNETFRPYFYFFFVSGIYIRQTSLKLPRALNVAIICTAFSIQFWLFYFPDTSINTAIYFILNVPLLLLILKKAYKGSFPRSKLIEWIGTNSLAIYLWHVIPIIFLSGLLRAENTLLFYTIIITLEVVMMLSIYYLKRLGPINKYVFGMTDEH